MKNFKIFISSPGDVQEERNIVEQVIKYLNITLNFLYNVNLTSIMWENNSFSSIGINAQDVINKQLLKEMKECRIYLGIMWYRFGTPTLKYGSGTEEEFNFFYKKYLKDNKSVDIKFYFNISEVLEENFSVEQYNKVLSFKKNIQEKGVLTEDYNSLLHFQLRVYTALFLKIYEFVSEFEYVTKEEILHEEIIRRHQYFIEVNNTLFIKVNEIDAKTYYLKANANNIIKELFDILSQYVVNLNNDKIDFSLNKEYNVVEELKKKKESFKTDISNFFNDIFEIFQFIPEFISAITNLLFVIRKSNVEEHIQMYLETKENLKIAIVEIENKISSLKVHNSQINENDIFDIYNNVELIKDELIFVKDLLKNLNQKL